MKAASAKLIWASVLALATMLQIPGCIPVPEYIVTAIVEGGGAIFLPPDDSGYRAPFTDDAFPEGTELLLTAEPDEGHRFVCWEGDVPPENAEDNPLTIWVNSEMSITAVFIRQFTLAADADGAGSIEVDGAEVAVPFDEVFDDGSEVVLTATAAEGWWFLGWEGDYSGTDPSITVTMDADTDVTAILAAVAGRRYVTVNGVRGRMTVGLQGSTVKGVRRSYDLGLDVDGTISGDEVVLTCTAPNMTPSTITATIESDGFWTGTIDGSGFIDAPFSADPVDFMGSEDGGAAVRTTLLPLFGMTGRLAVAAENGVLRGTWRFALDYGVDVEGTLTESDVTFTASAPGWESFTADGTVQADGSWVGVLNGSGFVDEPFEADAPFFP